MRKILFILLGVFYVMSSQAQKLFSDNTNEQFRAIKCTEINLTNTNEELGLSVSLSYMHLFNYDLKTWSLEFITTSKLPKKFSKDSRLLIKLQDNSLIELKLFVESNSYEGFEVGKIARNILLYNIKEDDVKALFKGIKKLRFETTIKNIDIELDSEISGDAIRNSYNIIQETINTKPKGFADDF